MTTTSPTAEVLEFNSHPAMIISYMRDQAGGRPKAWLEACMNAEDAGASRIDISLKPDHVTIIDDGKGMSTEEIRTLFRTFGQPHKVDAVTGERDAKFGKFRMGRGQMFNYGINVWHTRDNLIEVDVNDMERNNHLNFKVTSGQADTNGCRIEIDLYDRITTSEMLQEVEEIGLLVQFMALSVYLNGELINTPPQNLTWTEETDDAYIRINDGHTRGVQLYQQGVFVQTIPAWQVGASGIIVTKKELRLNQARNDVKRDDPIFKRVIVKFKKDTAVRARTKRDLNPDERRALFAQLVSGEENWRDNMGARLFPDTSGKVWTINTLRRVVGSEEFLLQGDGSLGFCFGNKGDRRADKVMQGKLGLVFNADLLHETNFPPATFFERIDYSLHTSFTHVPLPTLAKGMDDKLILVAPDKQTPIETAVLEALDSLAQYPIINAKALLLNEHLSWADKRVLRIGLADDSVHAWTDGNSFVAFNRRWLQKHGTGWGWTDIMLLFIHELCHDDEDTGTHVHKEEFWQLYHNITVQIKPSMGHVLNNVCAGYRKNTEKQVEIATKKQKKQKIKTQVHAENEAFLTALEPIEK